MSTTTALQLLPLIEPAQAQKHVTHNEALAVLDVLVQTAATSRMLTAPPTTVVGGACYIVGDNATGDWQGEDGHVAVYSGQYWDFYVPKTGWRVWVENEASEAVFNGADWSTSSDRAERVAALGISADADDANRLIVSSPATLLTHAGAGHQVKVNKAKASDTASVLFQSGYSGRAEMGIVGNDDFVLKVSADGTTFLTGLTIEAATGRVLASRGVNVVLGAGDPDSPQNGDIWYNATAHRLRARQDGQTVDLFDPNASPVTFTATPFGRNLINVADATAARTLLERQDFATRSAFVTWAAGRSPAIGLVMRAGNAEYRYAGTGSAIADLPGWVPNGTASALHWGADITGVTNAIPAVSAMIDYVNALGGGVALLPAGTYLWTGEMLKSSLNNVVLEGEGNATKLLRRTNRSAAAIKFFLGFNNRIRNLKIDCAGYSGIGVFLSDQYSGVENVEVVNCPDRPFAMRGGGNSGAGIDGQGRTSDDASFAGAIFYPLGCFLENCRVVRAGSTAFSQKQMPHSRIQGCFARSVYSEGVTIDKCDFSVVSNNTLLDCAITTGNQWPDLDAGTGYLAVGGGGVGAVGIDGSSGARFVNNTIIGVNINIATRNNRNRVAVNFVSNLQGSSGCVIEGNYISDAKAGIWLKGMTSGATGYNVRCVVQANVFDSMGTGAGTGLAQYGAIWLDAGCTDNVVMNNTQTVGIPTITGASSTNVIDQMPAATIKGNATGSVALGQDLTGAQVLAMLDTFSNTAKGLAPASGGGTSTFLRADGIWAAGTADWGGITGKPTSLAGYAITDAVSLSNAQTVSGAKTFSAPVVLSGLALDPATPANGSIWYNSTSGQFKAQADGVARTLQMGQCIPWLTPIAGEYMMTTVASSGTTGTLAQTANTLRMFPFTARADILVRGIALLVITAGAASVAKFVVYSCDANGRPNAKLLETADVDCSTVGAKNVTTTLALRSGQTYWLGVRANGSATLAAWAGSATPDINGGAPATAARKSVLRTLTHATAAPNPWVWAASEVNAASPWAIWLMA